MRGSGRRVRRDQREQLPVDAERRQLVGGQVDAAAVEVFADVAEEVGELERHAERRRGGLGVRPRAGRAQDRQHLEPDHGGGAVDVAVEVGERRVVGDLGVHAHRREEVGEVRAVDGVATGGVGQRGEHRVGGRAAVEGDGELLGERVEPGGLRGGRPAVAEVVDDLVGVPGEAVQRVHGGAAGAGEQPGGEEVGAAVAGVQRAAGGVRGPQARGRGCRRRPARRPRPTPAQLARGSAATGARRSAGGASAGFSGGFSTGSGLLRAPAASRSGSGFTSDHAASRATARHTAR